MLDSSDRLLNLFTFTTVAIATVWLLSKQQQRLESRRNIAKQAYKPKRVKDPDQYGKLCHYRPIGVCRTIFANKRGVPRQGALAPATRGVVKLNTEISPESLDGLNGFSHVWLIFVFSRNTNYSQTSTYLNQDGPSLFTFPGKVKPPLLLGKRVGLFSTRPNAIGLTLCKIESVKKRCIEVSGIDLCDKTPILDVKPYVPADMVEVPRFPDWLFERDEQSRHAKQINPLAVSGLNLNVEYSEDALHQLKHALSKKRTKFYKTVEEAIKVIDQLLGLDIRGVSQGRGENSVDDRVHKVWVDGLEIEFQMNESSGKLSTVCVQKITPKSWSQSNS